MGCGVLALALRQDPANIGAFIIRIGFLGVYVAIIIVIVRNPKSSW